MSPTHIVTFLQYSLLAKPYIQSRCLPGAEAPTSLPSPVDELLARCLNWEIDQVSAGWEVFRESVWGEELELRATEHQIQIYTALASDILQSSYRHIFPPTRFCTYPECAARLTEPVTHKATLHTLREGSLNVYTTSLYCRKCYVRYYHNYSVHNASSLRTYYDGVPDVIQVAPHFFIEAALLEFFVAGKVFGWLSAMNLARIYNQAMAPSHPHVVNNKRAFTSTWMHYYKPCQPMMREEDVLNGFFLYSLLLDKAEHNWRLTLPHNAPTQSDRLREALLERNQATEGTGQEAYPHICDVCCHVEVAEDGIPYKIQAAVCDGNQMGHPCCAVHDCKIPLRSHGDLFCPAHRHLEAQCAIEDCDHKREAGFRTCGDTSHRALETNYFAKGTAMFQLRARLRKAGVAVPTDSLVSSLEPSSVNETDECEGKSANGSKKVKAIFGPRRTHTQFLVMRPCGIILSRATMFGSEAVSGVNRILHATFPTPQSTPEFLFFDNNCKLVAHQQSEHDSHWDHTAQPVDVFHHQKKHRETDLFCQRYCNPAAFSELIVDGKWRFNSSICEQTNVWFGGYLAILRNMEVTRFNFYLDEMIKRRNRYIIDELERKGKNPVYVPTRALFPNM